MQEINTEKFRLYIGEVSVVIKRKEDRYGFHEQLGVLMEEVDDIIDGLLTARRIILGEENEDT